ncbi:AraC family transcriptional regulator [Variovorax sp. LjRoot290]|uniref:helix-turn-helix domain-containing protein n=1 Tax=Variovorax sp. LjRoot290 TaxID=3342316 RepID=UPI003ED17165
MSSSSYSLIDSSERVEQLIPRKGTFAARTAGAESGWVMPVALWEGPDGFDSSQEPDNRPYHVVAWRLSGALVQRVLSNRQPVEELSPHGFSIQPAQHDLRMLADGRIQFAHFCASEEFMRRVATEWAGERGDRSELLAENHVMRLDAEVIPMLDLYLRRALDEEDKPTRLEMDCRASLLMLQLVRKHSTLDDRSRRAAAGGLSPSHLRRVFDAMNADLSSEVSLANLARMVGLSYHHFCHAFKASTGVPPHQWLIEARVKRACELLRTTTDSISDISAAVGYDDPTQLARVFRARRGTTPQLYRRAAQA